METAKPDRLKPELENYLQLLHAERESIPPSRREKLNEIAACIFQNTSAGKEVNLIFICTHNSRRSQMAQLWAEACARQNGTAAEVKCYSGGTEATAFYPMAVRAMKDAGWHIEKITSHGEAEAVTVANPGYLMTYSRDEQGPSNQQAPVLCFSKHFSERPNPKKNFVAVMVCEKADNTCPFIPGAAARFALHYGDPKNYDSRPEASEKYDECCKEIAIEMNFLFRRLADLK
jgi:protein-tyrosine-phosphatase